MSENQETKLENLSYEELVEKLQIIVEDFQKGNMKLGDAVDKYNLCTKLIELCQQKLDTLTRKLELKENCCVDVKVVSFEKNIDELEQMVTVLGNDNVKLSELEKINVDSKRMLCECTKVLDDFENVIEYKLN